MSTSIRKSGLSSFINLFKVIRFEIIFVCKPFEPTNRILILSSSSKKEGPHEVCIYNDVEIVGSKGYMRFDITDSNGNCSLHDTGRGGAIATDVITIPKGKKWK